MDMANDLLSQTFLEAARGWQGYDGRASREAWLFGVARNTLRRARRSQRIRCAEPLSREPVAPISNDSVDDAQDLLRIRAAIAELPEHLRHTLTLRLADDMAYEHIAAVLDVPIGTVRSRLHEAVRRLRERLLGRVPE